MAYFKCKGGFKGFINITSTANATVTATTGAKSYSAVCDSSGYAQIKVKKKGAYNVTSTGTQRVATATVTDKTPVTAVYHWNKFNANKTYYSYENQSCGHGGGFYVSGTNYYGTSYEPSFDNTTGKWTTVNQYWTEVGLLSQSRGKHYGLYNLIDYTGTASSGAEASHLLVFWRQYSTFWWMLEYNYASLYIGSSGEYGVSLREYYSAYSWNKGTLIGDATSSNISAYTNGYNTDGYWYESN